MEMRCTRQQVSRRAVRRALQAKKKGRSEDQPLWKVFGRGCLKGPLHMLVWPILRKREKIAINCEMRNREAQNR
jgi:hypothetical protein